MPKILVFYEDGMIKELEMEHSPPASSYPTYTILYNPFTIQKWYCAFYFPMVRSNQWEAVEDITTISKRFRAYALISG